MVKNPLGKKILSDKVGEQKKDESDKEESEDYGAKSGTKGNKFAENCEIQKTG